MKKLLALLLLPAILFVACGEKPEKERFIDATVEVTCMIFESEDILDPALEQQTKDIFADHGFNVDDETAMQEIAARYENDADVQSAVEEALMKCAGDLFKNLGEDAVVEGEAEVLDGEAVTEDVPAPVVE